ncbi:MAG: hypothetical protein E5V40_01780 [Mesorhizobium sp.]|nr:MAG: hypothetical protein E5V40_01780 [Mesorhizobium sp.]
MQKNLGRRPIRNKERDSGVNGVHWNKKTGKWMARIKMGGKWIYLGIYPKLEDAVAIRRDAEKAYGFNPNHGRRPSVPKRAKGV